MTPMDAGTEGVWTAIEDEKRRDRLVRRAAVTAWSVTFLLLAVLGVLIGATAANMMRAVRVGAMQWMVVAAQVTPFIIILCVVALLIAALSTVGVFLRMRTTTLSEIQLRLAALEHMLAAKGDGQ
jgi:hypothetical protein